MSPRPFSVLLLSILALVIFVYGLFEARRIIEGPQITLFTPVGGSATSTTAVTIAGNAQNISFLTINGAASFTDQQGNFTETLSIPPGYALLTVAATDRFGRHTSKEVAINVLNYCIIPKNV